MKITTPPTEIYPPGDTIREELAEREWTQDDLAKITGKSVRAINQIICGKVAITPETAQQLAGAFGTSAEYWMKREVFYRLASSPVHIEQIRERARLYEFAPLKEMQKRGWISRSKDMGIVLKELCEFFGVKSIDETPTLEAATRTSAMQGGEATRAQITWCYRCIHLASALSVGRYDRREAKRAIPELRRLASRQQWVSEIPRVLKDLGIRFVIVQHLPKTRIDGAALWIEDSPVIALSLRYDRIDNFWHTLLHEFFHILHKDGHRLDLDIEGAKAGEAVDEAEDRADEGAANALIPKEKLDSFIVRVSPFYRKERIIQFANRNKIHPGIVVGQLQYREEVSWRANKDMLVNVRDIITKTALTDGWGCTIGKN